MWTRRSPCGDEAQSPVSPTLSFVVRQRVEFPRPLGREFATYADQQGVTQSALLYSLLLLAVTTVKQGRGELLPRGRAPRGSVGLTVDMWWSQSATEYREWADLLDSAGSSVLTCLRAAAQAYVDAGGSAVAMNWPPKGAMTKAA